MNKTTERKTGKRSAKSRGMTPVNAPSILEASSRTTGEVSEVGKPEARQSDPKNNGALPAKVEPTFGSLGIMGQVKKDFPLLVERLALYNQEQGALKADYRPSKLVNAVKSFGLYLKIMVGNDSKVLTPTEKANHKLAWNKLGDKVNKIAGIDVKVNGKEVGPGNQKITSAREVWERGQFLGWDYGLKVRAYAGHEQRAAKYLEESEKFKAKALQEAKVLQEEQLPEKSE